MIVDLQGYVKIDVGDIEHSDDPGKDDSVEKLEAELEYYRVIIELKDISFRKPSIIEKKDRLLRVLQWKDFLGDKSDNVRNAYEIIGEG